MEMSTLDLEEEMNKTKEDEKKYLMKRLKIHDIFQSYSRAITECRNADGLCSTDMPWYRSQGSMLGK